MVAKGPISEHRQSRRQGVKRETVILMTVGAFILGVLAGITYMVFREVSGKQERPATAVAPPTAQGPSRPSGPTAEQRMALLELQARVQRNPDDLEAWIQLGDLHFDLNEHLPAIRAYERALKLEPASPDVLTDLGIMYRRIGQPRKAVELFQEAHRVQPQHSQSLYNLGVVYLHDLDDIPSAVQAWEEYLRILPQGPGADRIRAILQKLREEGRLSGPD